MLEPLKAESGSSRFSLLVVYEVFGCSARDENKRDSLSTRSLPPFVLSHLVVKYETTTRAVSESPWW